MITIIQTSSSKSPEYADGLSSTGHLIGDTTRPQAVSVPDLRQADLSLDELTFTLVQQHPEFATNLATEMKKISALGTTSDGFETITSLRMAVGLTQVQLAEKIGVRQPNISALEAGQNGNLKRETMRRLCGVLNCDMNQLNSAIDNSIAMLNTYIEKRETRQARERDAA